MKDTLFDALIEHDISRRDFLKFCSAMAATLGLSAGLVPKIAAPWKQRETHPRLARDAELYRQHRGPAEGLKAAGGNLLLDVISLDYHETIMAAAGAQAEKSLADVVKNQKGKYFAVVEGSIPAKDGGIYCCIGGRTSLDIAREVCGNAAGDHRHGHLCLLSEAFLPPARIPRAASSVKEAVPGISVVNLSGCPVNAENITATIVHYLTFGCSRRSMPSDARSLRTVNGSTTTASGAPTSTRGSMCGSGGTKAIGGAGASTRWGARARGLPELPHRPLQRRDELARRVRTRLHRMRGTHFWDDMTPSTAGCPAVRHQRGDHGRQGRPRRHRSHGRAVSWLHAIARADQNRFRRNLPKEEPSKPEEKTEWKGPTWHE